MATPNNPFTPPKATTLEAETHDAFVRDGRKVASGRGTAWIGEAWDLFKMAPGTWIAIFIVYMIMSLVLAFMGIGGIISSLLYPVFTAGIMLGCRSLESGEGLRFEHLFAGFKDNVGNLILVGLLYLAGSFLVGMVAVVIMFAAFAGLGVGAGLFTGEQVDPATVLFTVIPLILLLVLLVVALTLPLVMALWFAPPLVLFHNLQPMEAMKASFSGCMRNMWPFLIYGIVFFLLLIVAMIPLGLGLLVVSPMIWASVYTAYRDIYVEQ